MSIPKGAKVTLNRDLNIKTMSGGVSSVHHLHRGDTGVFSRMSPLGKAVVMFQQRTFMLPLDVLDYQPKIPQNRFDIILDDD